MLIIKIHQKVSKTKDNKQKYLQYCICNTPVKYSYLYAKSMAKEDTRGKEKEEDKS